MWTTCRTGESPDQVPRRVMPEYRDQFEEKRRWRDGTRKI